MTLMKDVVNSIRYVINLFIPPLIWRPFVIILLGVISGLGLYIIYISKAPSYLSEKPAVCMNCHIMAPEYASWSHSSHRSIATCNECHVPQDNIFSHYFFKAKDGLRHSYMFTFKLEPDVIKIHEAGANVVHENCKRCHYEGLWKTNLVGLNYKNERRCWACHSSTPHGTVRGLSSVPNARVPTLGSPVPEWIQTLLKNTKILNAPVASQGD